MKPQPPKPNAGPASLIFAWRDREFRGFRLFFLGVIAVLFVGSVLLLFQVVYPSTRPIVLTPQRIWLLDPGVPGARQIMAAAADRDYLLLQPTPASQSLPALGQQVPVFSPSFKNRTLVAKDFLETRAKTGALPRVFQPQDAPLPPRAKSLPIASVVPPPYTLRAVVTAGLPGRGIVKPVILPYSEPVPETDCSYHVAVGADGQVKIVVPITDAAARSESYHSLRAYVARLRFDARPKTPVEWGTVTFRWLEDAP